MALAGEPVSIQVDWTTPPQPLPPDLAEFVLVASDGVMVPGVAVEGAVVAMVLPSHNDDVRQLIDSGIPLAVEIQADESIRVRVLLPGSDQLFAD